MSKSLILFFVIILILVSFTSVYTYSQASEGKINLTFTDQVLEELNQLYLETPDNVEFLGVLKENNYLVNKFNLVGFKDLDNNQTELIKVENLNQITIHSHPQELLCLPSLEDRLVFPGTICVICSENRIKCFEN